MMMFDETVPDNNVSNNVCPYFNYFVGKHVYSRLMHVLHGRSLQPMNIVVKYVKIQFPKI